jgi:hypothetical protein
VNPAVYSHHTTRHRATLRCHRHIASRHQTARTGLLPGRLGCRTGRRNELAQIGNNLLTLIRTQSLQEHLPAGLPYTLPVEALPFEVSLACHTGFRLIQPDQLSLVLLGVPPAQHPGSPFSNASPGIGARGLHDRYATCRR